MAWQPELAAPTRCRVGSGPGSRPDNAVGQPPLTPSTRGNPLCSRPRFRLRPRAAYALLVSACYFILIENENVISLPTKMLAASSATELVLAAAAAATAAAGATASASNEKRANVAKFV